MYLLVFSLSLLSVISQNGIKGAGIVKIGFSAATTTTSVYTFTPNETPFIPVYISTNDGTAITDTVNVTCQILSTASTALPFTNAAFGFDATMSSTNLNANLTVSITQLGRAVEFYCYGVSIGAGTQFTAAASRSLTKSIRGIKAPTVSICTPTIAVPILPAQTAAPTAAVSFQIKLSAAVVTNNITVNCSITNPAAGSMAFTVSPTTITASTTLTYSLSFTVTTLGTAVTLACTAESVAPGTQYKYSNSQGATSVVSSQTSSVTFIETQAQIQAATSFQLALVLDSPRAMTFVCAVSVVTTNAEATAAIANRQCTTATTNVTSVTDNPTTATAEATLSTVTPTTPSSANATITSANATWGVSSSGRLQFTVNEVSKLLTVSRSAVPTTTVIERLVVICCGVATIAEPQLSNLYSASEVTVTFPSLATVNASQDNTNVETVLQNPAYVNPAPCPCDLLPAECDIGCCCDRQCTTADKSLTTCLPGYFGGDAATIPPSNYSCSAASNLGQPDYSQFMCIMYENNAVLGLFYVPTTARYTLTQINNKIAANLGYSVSLDVVRVPTEQSISSSGYLKGNAILMDTGTTAYTAGLTLPETASGGCEEDGFVRFLDSRTSACPVTLTNTCSGATLSARNYALSSGLLQPACPTYPKIRAAGSGSTATVATTVRYFCVQNSTLLNGNYVPGSATVAANPSVTGFSTVTCTLLADNITYTCNATGLGSGSSALTVVATRCTFDDGETLPPAPSYSAALNSCANTIISVSYNFAWNASVLTALQADYILATVDITKTLTQQFKVNFTYGNIPTNLSAVPAKRSGKFGYDDGLPLIGGKLSNTSSNTVDRLTSNQPFMIVPGADGLCTTVGTEPILFPYPVQASCQVYLKLSDLNNCNLLRTQMLTYLNQFVPFDYVATYGDPTSTLLSDWASVVVNTTTLNAIENATATNASASTANITTSTTGILFSNLLQYRCVTIPTSIIVSVVYAKQGDARGVPIFQVVGVEKSYGVSNMEITCDSSPNSPCVDTTKGKAFNLYLSYRFREAPAVWKTNLYASFKQSIQICWWGICSQDILGLWTSVDYIEIRQNIIAYTLVCLLIGLPSLYITWPW